MQEEDDEDLEYWIEYDEDYDKDSGLQDRKFIFYYGEEQYDAAVMDLPTITESYKTLDNKNLYKSNNIYKVLEVASTPRVMDPETKHIHKLKSQINYFVKMVYPVLVKIYMSVSMNQQGNYYMAKGGSIQVIKLQ